MSALANPLETPAHYDTTQKQTVEMRSPDSSADVYQLMAGLCVACRHGLEMPKEEALRIAADKYVNVDIHKAENAAKLAALEQLPVCCVDSAACLERQREVYEEAGVFSPRMIDGIIRTLRAFDDTRLHETVSKDSNQMLALVRRFFHCG